MYKFNTYLKLTGYRHPSLFQAFRMSAQENRNSSAHREHSIWCLILCSDSDDWHLCFQTWIGLGSWKYSFQYFLWM